MCLIFCAKLPENQEVQFKAEGLRIRIAMTRGVYAITIIHLLYLLQVILRDWGDFPDDQHPSTDLQTVSVVAKNQSDLLVYSKKLARCFDVADLFQEG